MAHGGLESPADDAFVSPREVREIPRTTLRCDLTACLLYEQRQVQSSGQPSGSSLRIRVIPSIAAPLVPVLLLLLLLLLLIPALQFLFLLLLLYNVDQLL